MDGIDIVKTFMLTGIKIHDLGQNLSENILYIAMGTYLKF